MHKDQHYYVLQDASCPVETWDWREYATCYGPFKDFDAGLQHLDKNHANPGGFTVGKENTKDQTLIRLVEERNQCCRMCGHEATDRPQASFDIMEFRQHGWTTFGYVKEHGVCIPCYTSMMANGDIK